MPQGLKPVLVLLAFSARLKSCPFKNNSALGVCLQAKGRGDAVAFVVLARA
jgi:hypothetical protein